jgi:4-amino-4-deoxy-L-arabinose transferase-like glycosyltransferase
MPTVQQNLQPAPAGPTEDTLPPQSQGIPRARGVRWLGGRSLAALRGRGEVILLLAVASLLDFWNLSINQWANLYYAAAVRSMSTNWHNFLYVSLDPSGVASVDKPPLALWIEALSVRVFGYHPLSILIPEAVMGVTTVVLLYDLVRRLFGRIAGFTAGIALATTPITVAMSRHNNTDALLVLLCVAAVWFFVRALEEDRTLWIILSGVMVGLGFETKMLIALVVVPGMVVAWLWLRPGGWKRALDQLAASGIAMLAIGSAWPLAVQLTPVANRPWISGTGNNNILTLIFGYNGLGRVAGEKGGPATAEIAKGRSGTGGVYAGTTGPFRLLNYALGGQEGWLLGVSIAALIIIGVSTRFRRSDPRSGWLVAVGITFLVTAAVFSSAAGIFHPYYV